MPGCSVETEEFIFYTRNNADEVQFKFSGHLPKSVSSMAVDSPKDLLDEPSLSYLADLNIICHVMQRRSSTGHF